MKSFLQSSALTIACLLLLASCSSSVSNFPDPTTEIPTAQSPTAPSYCLQKGKQAEQAGDLSGAYYWYDRGGTVTADAKSTLPQVSYNTEPEASAYFLCVLNFIRICEDFAQRGIIIGPEPTTEWLDGVGRNNFPYLIATADAQPNHTYCGYTTQQLQTASDEAETIFTQARAAYNNNEQQHYANVQNTLDGLNAAASALNAGVAASNPSSAAASSAGSAPSAGSNANVQAAISQCSGPGSAYATWTSRCQTNNNGANQGPCYCAAAALLRCYYESDPNDPNVGQWKQAYQQNIQSAQSVGMRCFPN